MSMATYLPDLTHITNNVIQWEENMALHGNNKFNLIKIYPHDEREDIFDHYARKYDHAFTWMRLKGIELSPLFKERL